MKPELSILLPQLALAGVYRLPVGARAALQAAAGDLGYAHADVDAGQERTAAGVLMRLGAALQFSEDYGVNFDALHDCLTDFGGCAPVAGRVFVVSGLDAFHAGTPDDFATLLEVFAAAADFWRDEALPCWFFIDLAAADPGLAQLP